MMNQTGELLQFLFTGDFFAKEPFRITISDELNDWIKASDVCCCNFEAPVETAVAPVVKSGPSLAQSIDSPRFLEKVGFNVISMANNHMADYGNEGIENTIKQFSEGLLVGVGNYSNAYALQIKEVKGFKIGFLAFTHREFGVLDDPNDDTKLGCAWINHPCVDELIVCSKAKVDLLFVISHAGVEDIPLPLPEWRDRYQKLLSLGADAIIASHPHVPQGWEVINQKPIFYSLGNFYFDMHSDTPFWNESLMAVIKYDGKKYLGLDVVNLQKKGESIVIDKSVSIMNYTQELCVKLKDDTSYKKEIDRLALECWMSYYEKYIYQSINGITLKCGMLYFVKSIFRTITNKPSNYPLLLNTISCESHRWCIVRALEQMLVRSVNKKDK